MEFTSPPILLDWSRLELTLMRHALRQSFDVETYGWNGPPELARPTTTLMG